MRTVLDLLTLSKMGHKIEKAAYSDKIRSSEDWRPRKLISFLISP